MWCVKSTTLSILWNGEKLTPFNPPRGLWQGDPLSPYLFVLCMEMLALNIQQKVYQGIWKPIQVSRGGPGISHLFFPDDVLLFCHAIPSQVQVVMESVDDFCIASGLKVNFEKSKAMCSAKVPRYRQRELSQHSSINLVSSLGIYLGFPLINGRVNKGHYTKVVERIQTRMASWKSRLLNKAGKLCLVKSVTSSMPVYTMQTHLLPKSVCTKIDSITRNFFWGKREHQRGWHLLNWEVLTTPRNLGRLGIRDMKLTNLALLGKLVWSLLHERDKLWVQVITYKYRDSSI